MAEIKARVQESAEFANVRRARILVDFYEERFVLEPKTGKGVKRLVMKDLAILPQELTAAVHSVDIDPRTGEKRVELHTSWRRIRRS